jgi:hypothetical protein
MGLDAFVCCNCFPEGKIKPPPFPSEWVRWGEEGIDIRCQDGNQYKQVYDWASSCCSHPHMHYVNESIASWAAFRLLQEAFEDVGWQHFPILKRVLPIKNDGHVTSEDSRIALQELETLRNGGHIGEKTVLVNVATGQVLQERIRAYDGVFIWSSRDNTDVEVGLSPSHLFMRDGSTHSELFRAKHIRQFREDNAAENKERIVWENVETGERYKPNVTINATPIPTTDGAQSWAEADLPAELRVEVHPRTVNEFNHIIAALAKVFSASVETDNPVVWC